MAIASFNYRTALIGLGLALSLGACSTPDTVSRSGYAAPGITLATQGRAVAVPGAAAAGPRILAAQYDVQDVRINVSRKLKVSEANVFYPMADIVWRGEPRGDRYRQVAAMYQEAMAAGTGGMTSGRAVNVDINVNRHHGLTEKTRYTVGGVHSLRFMLTVTDAATGQVIDGPREVVADVKAAGGNQAIIEEQNGRTQRVVVVERLAQVIRRELSQSVVATPELTARLQSDVTVTVAGLGQ
ncbi:MAG: DUF6778 family protein [Pseudomonadota bacterium]